MLIDSSATDVAAACFEQAIKTARSQGALMFELAAATAMSRILAERGDRRAAYALTSEVYARFSAPAKNTASPPTLEAARILLEKLADHDRP